MARATWSGAISFGLVSVPVKLFTAVRKQDVRFRQLHAETHNRVRRRKVDAQTGEEVDTSDIVKGYETDDGRYVVVDPDELAELDPEASRTIEIHDFVDLDDIDPIYYDRPYYLGPDGEQARKPYELLVTAMERSSKVAIGTFVMRTKEHLGAIRAKDGLLVLSTMNYADEVVDPGEVEGADREEIEVTDRELEMAGRLIDSLTTDFDPAAYRDRHRERVLEFIERKAAGEEIAVPAAEEEAGEVVDLMAALEASLERGSRGGGDGDDAGSHQAGEEASADGPPAGDSLAAMTRDELYELAQERDVPGRSSMTKDELVAALSEADERIAS
jgi:DNA end-binding protein Ku